MRKTYGFSSRLRPFP